MEPIKLLAISAGAVVGALLRYAVVLTIGPPDNQGLPYGILAVNWIGSFCIAYLAILFTSRVDVPGWVVPFLIIGLLGSFTTFSTFSLDTLRLIQQGAAFHALLYTILSVVGGILLAFLGYWLAHKP